MKKIMLMFIISLLLAHIVIAQEFDWDGEGTQTLSLFERILQGISSRFTAGATIPNQCSLQSHTQKVFDANGRTQLTSVGSACNSGDYIALFNCGLESKYSSPSACNYGGSIREGFKPITTVLLNPDFRYMYFCYDCDGTTITPPSNGDEPEEGDCIYSGVSIPQGTSKCIGQDKVTCGTGKTLDVDDGACDECIDPEVRSHNVGSKICIGQHPFSEFAWTCQSGGEWKKELCQAGCDDGNCKAGVCFDGQFRNEECSDDDTRIGEECISGQWQDFEIKCDIDEECDDGQCQPIIPPDEDEPTGICSKTLGASCTPQKIGFSGFGDDSGQSNECASGWCQDTPALFEGRCAKVGTLSNGERISAEPHPDCVPKIEQRQREQFCGWTTWSPDWFGTQCTTAYIIVIGGIVILLFLSQLRGGKN